MPGTECHDSIDATCTSRTKPGSSAGGVQMQEEVQAHQLVAWGRCCAASVKDKTQSCSILLDNQTQLNMTPNRSFRNHHLCTLSYSCSVTQAEALRLFTHFATTPQARSLMHLNWCCCSAQWQGPLAQEEHNVPQASVIQAGQACQARHHGCHLAVPLLGVVIVGVYIQIAKLRQHLQSTDNESHARKP